MGPFSGNTFAPVIAPLDHSAHRSRAVNSALPAKRSVRGATEFGSPQAFLVKQLIDRRMSFLVHRRRDFLPHPLDHVSEAAVGLCPDLSIAAGDPLVRERVGPDPEVSHRAQEGQGCADHDVSGRRRAAEAPRAAQKPCTSLTIALTDTAASGPEPQRRPCATSRHDAGAVRH
jgi:hypothetical protein